MPQGSQARARLAAQLSSLEMQHQADHTRALTPGGGETVTAWARPAGWGSAAVCNRRSEARMCSFTGGTAFGQQMAVCRCKETGNICIVSAGGSSINTGYVH